MSRFAGKVAIVTGGRSGIGRAIAARLREEGARVFTVQRGPDPDFEHVLADLSEKTAPARVVDEVLARGGRLDVLVNNAGIMQEAGLEETDLEAWQQTLAVNLTAPFLMIKHALPHLRVSSGTIVNIGSIEGIGCNPGHAAYSASKAGLHGLTRAVAVDHGPEGIRCNAVAPGWIDTDLNEDFIASMSDPERFRQEIGSIHPLGRTGTVQEVAALVAFLASTDSGFITGQIYVADGGRMTQLSLP